MLDVAERRNCRVQLTSDGHKPYLEAIEGAFGADLDYAVLQKTYGTAPEAAKGRYRLPERIGAIPRFEVMPDDAHISMPYMEASELHDTDAHTPLHAAYKHLLEEG